VIKVIPKKKVKVMKNTRDIMEALQTKKACLKNESILMELYSPQEIKEAQYKNIIGSNKIR
jgi:hypothetical protein